MVGEVPVWVVAERVQYYGKDGKLITESFKDYTKKTVREEFASLDDFLRRWTQAERKAAVTEAFAEQGVLLDALAEEAGKEFDPFDLVCHVAFDHPPLTRRWRAEQVRKRDVFARYGEKAQEVVAALLDKYADGGIENVEDLAVLRVQPLARFGTPVEIVNRLGGRNRYLATLQDLESSLHGAGPHRPLGVLVKRCYHSSIEKVSLEVRMNTRFSEDVIPLTDLKVNPGRVVKHAAESRRPVLLTSRGRGVAIVQSVAEYEKEQEERGFLRAVVEGLADLEEGREISLGEAKARLGLK